MGIGEDNASLISHRAASGTENDYSLHHHHQNKSIDDKSSTYDQNDHDTLKTKAGESFANFDTEMSSVLGTWWDDLPTSVQEQFHEVYKNV